MARQREGLLATRIRTALMKRYGDRLWLVKIHGGLMQRAGIPDLIGCLDGRFIALEVKLPDGHHRLTRLQKVTLRQIAAAGGLAGVVRSVSEAEALVAGPHLPREPQA